MAVVTMQQQEEALQHLLESEDKLGYVNTLSLHFLSNSIAFTCHLFNWATVILQSIQLTCQEVYYLM